MSVYKQPINVPNADISYPSDPNNVSASDATNDMPARRVSGGNPANTQINKNGGMKQRGSGAATKGFTSRGPMA